MLLELSQYLTQYYSGFSLFSYLTLRAILSVLTALTIALLAGAPLIDYLRRLKINQVVRSDGPQSHQVKVGTPTMGGSLILFAITISTLLWAELSNRFVWIALVTTLLFGVIGGFDDYRKLVLRDAYGISAKWKFLLQSVVGFCCAVVLYMTATSPHETNLIVPVFKEIAIDMEWMYVVFSYFVIVGSSNAVNLTDGLDGLAIMPTVMIAGALGVFAYVIGHSQFADYLGFPFINGVGELLVFCSAMVGSGLGFLWFNAYPAQVFMGDIGALALGAALGVLAVITRQELVLLIMGGVFVVETLSVILQVGSYKLTGRRLFRMAPLHHHFELKGWPEPLIIVRFWIIALVLVLAGIATLKIR